MGFNNGWEPPADTAVHCAYCLHPAPETGGTRCPRCKVVYHPDCWAANNSRCAVYGCEPGVPAAAPAPAVRPRTTTSTSSGGRSTWIIIGVVMFVLRIIASTQTSKVTAPKLEKIRMARDWVQGKTPAPPDYSLKNFDSEGVFENTIESYTRALERNPRSVQALEGRAYLRYDQQEWTSALADFRRALAQDGPHEDYLRLRIWLIQARTGERSAGDLLLAGRLEPGYPREWPSVIAEYLLGRKSESDLQFKAATKPRECQALFYIGSRRLVDGDRDGAREFLLRCVETRCEDYREYHSAVAELRTLK